MPSTDEAQAKDKSGSVIPGVVTRNLQLAAAIVLSLAALVAAWSAYQSAEWGSVQSSRSGDARANRTESTRLFTFAGQLQQIDVDTFNNWLNALQADIRAGDVEPPPSAAEYEPTEGTLSGFLFERFRPGFQPAVDAWLDTNPFADPNAPGTPFAMPEYVLAEREEAVDLQAEVDQAVQEADDANHHRDAYSILAVFAALVLFAAGLSARLKTPGIEVLLLLLAIAGLVGIVVRVVILPAEIS